MGQYIVCRVKNQFFTISILETNRIIPLKGVTPVPDTLDYLMGIMETEGEILPVIDLSERFFGEPIKDEEAAQVIIVYWKEREIGIAVNEVQTIREFEASQIDDNLKKVTAFNQESDYTPIKSFIRTEEGLILEVAIDNLFETTATLKIQELVEGYEESMEVEEAMALSEEE